MESINRAEALRRITALTQEEESALVVIGEPGRGKTSMLQFAARTSVIRSELVQTPAGESTFVLSGFSSVFDAIRGEHAANFSRQFELRSDEPNGVFAAAHDLLDLVRGLNLPPTLVLIDDVDQMDPASQSLVGVIAAHLSGTGLRIVAACSSLAPSSPLVNLPTVELAPATISVLTEDFSTRTPDTDDSTLHILAGYAGGNPAVFAEQCGLLQPDQLQGTTWLTLPPGLTPTLERVTGWPEVVTDPDQRTVLETVSLAPLCHVDALKDLLGDSADVLEDLLDAHVLQRRGSHVTFVDPRLRAHVYWTQQARSRRQRHVELTGLVAVHDEHLACWHHSFSVMGEDTVAKLLAAAVRLVGLQRVPEAVEFAERALRHTTHLETHSQQLIAFCAQLLGSGDISLAVRYSHRTRTFATDPRQVMELAALKLSAQLFDRQVMGDEEAKALVALHAEEHLDRASDLLTLTAFYRAERWEVEEARQLIEPAQARAAQVSAPTRHKIDAVLDILDALDGVPRGPGPPEAHSVDASGSVTPEVLLMRGRALTLREQYAEARGIFTLVLNHPTSRTRIWSDLATYASIGNEIAAGEFRLAREAIDTWGTASPWVNRGTAAHALIRSWYYYSLGQTDEARQLAERVLGLASKEASLGSRARAYALCGAIDLLDGDPESAVLNLRHVSAMSRRFRNPGLLRHWADYTEACVLTNRHQEANAATTALERRVAAHESRWSVLALARCRALVQGGPESLPLFDKALEMFDWGELPYEFGRTTACFADRQDALGVFGDGRHQRVSAVTAFEGGGADAWARHALASTPDAEPVDTSSLLDHLTSQEREVAQCVLRGMRTREIAGTLYVSVRTVELRLTRIYRTLEVRSRGELVALLSGQLPPAA